ncbi:MAG: hydrogenase small subunit [Desulfosarcina sp.]|nr:hydrogenase small subunit [Desulfobacterales bacterium]
MKKLTRRDFLGFGLKIAALTGISPAALPKIVSALEQLSGGNAPVLWLQGQSCSGCSVSLLNSAAPGPAEILTSYISLLFHSTLSTATGATSMNIIDRTIKTGDFLLVVEGSIPAGMPEACIVGGEKITNQIKRAAIKAKAVIANGTCATFGGIPAAENNQTGAVCVSEFLKNEGVSTPVINLPGCPSHPDWLVGTLVHVLKFGLPPVDKMGRPEMFYSRLVHDQCPRYPDYERENFAKDFSDSGCLFKLGCLGPVTRADCTIRHWNSGTSSCIKSGGGCIGCASENFAKDLSFPFYTKNNMRDKKEGV